MAIFAYLLSFATALACAVLLTRAAGAGRARLLFWSAICFWVLTASNALALLDVFLVPDIDLYWLRLSTAVGAVVVLLYGMVWESN
jgi:hypothetical protein